MKERRIQNLVLADLKTKMVFVAGPRQCGKTTLAHNILQTLGGEGLNWDVDAHRRRIRNTVLSESARLWAFDELHKFPRWRNWIKGVFDIHHKTHPILVTGSARLDMFRHGGDSLQGRYYLHRLHPFTFSEWLGIPAQTIEEIPKMSLNPPPDSGSRIETLLTLGGFPEPLLSGSDREAQRWRHAYGTRLIREDVRDLTQLRDLDRLELLHDRLPATVGSVLSLNSLREDLEVSFQSVQRWVRLFEQFYTVFRLPPFGPPRIKAVKKEQKLYLWDWPRVDQRPARLENLVAFHLLRLTHWVEDTLGEKFELRYFRDVVGHEVDFIVMRRSRPWMAVEVKSGEGPLDHGLAYLLQRTHVPFAFQVHLNGETDRRPPDINGCRVRLLPLARFLTNLP